MVIHDATLERTTDGIGLVSDYTAAELFSLNAAHSFPGWPEREGVPALQDVLERYQADIGRWQLEIKTDAPERLSIICALLAQQIDRFKLRNRVTVTSFDPVALEIQREVAPYLRLGLIKETLMRGDIDRAQILGCSELCISVKSGSKSLISTAKEAGLKVTGWVGNTPAELETLLNWGVDAITTDVPAFARPYLAARQRLV
jgi:glycerophosphoryl diester phosphodiesterase